MVGHVAVDGDVALELSGRVNAGPESVAELLGSLSGREVGASVVERPLEVFEFRRVPRTISADLVDDERSDNHYGDEPKKLRSVLRAIYFDELHALLFCNGCDYLCVLRLEFRLSLMCFCGVNRDGILEWFNELFSAQSSPEIVSCLDVLGFSEFEVPVVSCELHLDPNRQFCVSHLCQVVDDHGVVRWLEQELKVFGADRRLGSRLIDGDLFYVCWSFLFRLGCGFFCSELRLLFRSLLGVIGIERALDGVWLVCHVGGRVIHGDQCVFHGHGRFVQGVGVGGSSVGTCVVVVFVFNDLGWALDLCGQCAGRVSCCRNQQRRHECSDDQEHHDRNCSWLLLRCWFSAVFRWVCVV